MIGSRVVALLSKNESDSEVLIYRGKTFQQSALAMRYSTETSEESKPHSAKKLAEEDTCSECV